MDLPEVNLLGYAELSFKQRLDDIGRCCRLSCNHVNLEPQAQPPFGWSSVFDPHPEVPRSDETEEHWGGER